MDASQQKNFPQINRQRFLIAGPCSVESHDQVISTAEYLSTLDQMSVFRAGVWKPRTRAGQFEGLGKKALPWLQEVKQKTGLKVAVEVAQAQHAAMALEAGMDILWIGARTVVNPFSVQEIADAIKGTNIPVMVKNPVNPDLNLWIGAIERFQQAGISEIAAIHRGFYFFDDSPYRNAPMWEIPIELKRLYPELPLICDPSHICGTKGNIPEVAQKALDLEMEGLMIEVHPEPENAITDAAQQLSFDELKQLLDNLVLRSYNTKLHQLDPLTKLRSEIDKIDREMLEILARRMNIIREIGHYKKAHNVTILQSDRFREMIKDRLAQAEKYDLDKSFLLKLLQQIHKESVRQQQNILEDK
ncbi:MAG: bifunctional 3-deoxy-7-phosphoheptulonate synthase/chorismate mutase type II [Bacteroidales bacterium]|nr:bifunctional 3-deoxy-7-phosphoheptulonate synthase/chorismate mutase type II [Bacteroidales bacterium]MCF8327055.1 bifunctional 3-deoxy-7-phosphoheptulonate synthase/chorismate mutase type II [Bacteroidales bacterium]